MKLVFIYGPPGVGKLAVATELAKLTGYKLFDNHTRFGFIKRLFDFGSPEFWRLEARIGGAIIDEALNAEVSVISTFVAPNAGVIAFLAPFLSTLEKQGGLACFVGLSCEQETLEERVQQPGRSEAGKLTNVHVLRRMLRDIDFTFAVRGRAALTIDNTRLSPEAVAGQIVNHYRLNS